MAREHREKFNKLDKALVSLYGDRKKRGGDSILDEITTRCLLHFLTEKEAGSFVEAIHKKFIDWNEFRVVRPGEAVKTLGVDKAAIKAANAVRKCLNAVVSEKGSLNLSFFSEMAPPEIKKFFAAVGNLSKKDINHILLVCFDVPVFPIDEETLEVLKRFSMVPLSATCARARRILSSLVPAEHIYRFYSLIEHHKEKLCFIEKPLCHKCRLKRRCRYKYKNKPR